MSLIHTHVVYFNQRFCCKKPKKRKKAHFLGNKTVDQHFGANLKNVFFAKICCNFLAFLSFLQRKRWSKYTTPNRTYRDKCNSNLVFVFQFRLNSQVKISKRNKGNIQDKKGI